MVSKSPKDRVGLVIVMAFKWWWLLTTYDTWEPIPLLGGNQVPKKTAMKFGVEQGGEPYYSSYKMFFQ